ncbi:DNA damage-binding protein 2-like isoform X1 [Ptychodera flava]|uniref:DNA damage-binding protein 2-like isoform X1 n=1 Tax=Ptychodera flava TaxID=63121 RepID=UPI003969F740
MPTSRQTKRKRQQYKSTDDVTPAIEIQRKKRHVKNDVNCNTDKENSETDLLLPKFSFCGGKERRVPNIPIIPPVGKNSNNLMHHMYNTVLGRSTQSNLRKCLAQPFIRMLSNSRLFRTASPFDRRVTALEWHPTEPYTLAAGSKGGDIILWNHARVDKQEFISGIGKGGSITAMKFNLDDPCSVFTSSINGTVSLQDFNGKHNQILLDTCDWNYWYCSVDVSYTANLIVTGDNVGNTVLLSRDGKELWKYRLHKQKVSHCEFNPQCDWLVVTSSVDKTVKLWDIRMVKDRKSALHVLEHQKPVNSAYFSPDSHQLLTTDQHNEIRIYQSPDWSRVKQTIAHPHRFFQHITPIKATWHPVCDLVVVGRYPDENFPGYVKNEARTIDLFDANTGEIVCQLHDPKAPGLISLNKFNKSGDALASAMGYNILIWLEDKDIEQRQQELVEKMKAQGIAPKSNQTQTRRRQRKTDSKMDAATKAKIAAKLQQR